MEGPGAGSPPSGGALEGVGTHAACLVVLRRDTCAQREGLPPGSLLGTGSGMMGAGDPWDRLFGKMRELWGWWR